MDATERSFDVPFRIDGCDYAEFSLRALAVLVAPFVPTEFFALPTGFVTIVLGAATCSSATTENATGAARFYWNDVSVEPIDDRLRADGITTYLYRIENFVLDDLYGDLMARVASERDVVDEVHVSLALPLVSFEAGTATTLHVGDGGPAVMIHAPIGSVPFREYGAAPGGLAYVEGNLHSTMKTGRYAGVFRPASGTVAFDVFGPATGGQFLFGPGFTFGDARMGFVAL